MARESKMFVNDEAKISSEVGGVKLSIVYFGKLTFESDEQKFSLRGVKSKKISNHPGWDAWVKIEWVEREEEPSIICIKVVVEEKGSDKSTERGSVPDKE